MASAVLVLVVCALALLVLTSVAAEMRRAKIIRRSSRAPDTIVTIFDFLDAQDFATLQHQVEELQHEEHRSNTYLRRGASLSHLDVQGEATAAIFELAESRDILVRIERGSGLRLQLVPATDPSRLSLLSYTEPGDFMDWHLDGNEYYGERWVGILTLINRSENAEEPSSAELQFRMSDGSISTPPTPENSLTLFRGDQVRHRVSPVAHGERRVALSLLLCDVCQPTHSMLREAYQTVVNLVFYGHA